MLATLLLELSLGVYVLLRFKLNQKGRIILALIICLAVFQAAEYFVCTQSGFAVAASRLGYVAVTLLPPLGLYLMSLLTTPLAKLTKVLLMAITTTLITYFAVAPNAFQGYVCTGNYVIFQIGSWQAWVYALFYYSLLAAAIWRGSMQKQAKPSEDNALAIQWLLVGYLVFIVPVAVLVVFQPDSRDAIPSIMCGFAVTLAIILAAKLAPLVMKRA